MCFVLTISNLVHVSFIAETVPCVNIEKQTSKIS